MTLKELIQKYVDECSHYYQLKRYDSMYLIHISQSENRLRRKIKIIKPNEEVIYVQINFDKNNKIKSFEILDIISMSEPFALVEEIEKGSAESLFNGHINTEETYDKFWFQLYNII